MSYQNILNSLFPKKPIFNTNYAILSAPVRHIFMMATVWYIKKHLKRSSINILEIGSWFGASTLSWAQGLEEHNNSKGSITCVDAWQPFFDKNTHTNDVYNQMEMMLSSDVAYNVFLHNINTVPETILCQHLRGRSDNILPILKENQFDIIFIDADHTYKAVKKDINNSLNLLKDGGIICGDDLNLQLHQCDKKIALESGDLDFIKDPKTGKNYHPGVTCAVAEIFGEVSSWGGFWAMQKRGTTWVKPSYKDMPISYPKHFPDDANKRAKEHFEDLIVE